MRQSDKLQRSAVNQEGGTFKFSPSSPSSFSPPPIIQLLIQNQYIQWHLPRVSQAFLHFLFEFAVIYTHRRPVAQSPDLYTGIQ